VPDAASVQGRTPMRMGHGPSRIGVAVCMDDPVRDWRCVCMQIRLGTGVAYACRFG